MYMKNIQVLKKDMLKEKRRPKGLFKLIGLTKVQDNIALVYDMKGKLNDQPPKPKLGNSPLLHGKVNTDMPGGYAPSHNRPTKTVRRKNAR